MDGSTEGFLGSLKRQPIQPDRRELSAKLAASGDYAVNTASRIAP
jgi:hypothetical protein